ncbi:uncharacterized protein TM35_000311530 [Trypanosoma theileri]|uniref:Uncharacterized protein n=1 Tax=Trypanosoma theileri TaxID=67003 RepID=A0A1X0NMQ2_9TRYP|nr:uncharacterized protein TM35_000311530 [Trypanosoma theileri]ORC85967.1 hypothetical protein TM35_000311530 [Trypanosoma theileri]
MSMLPCRVLCLLAIVFCCVGVSDATGTSQARQVSANNTAPLVGDTIATSGGTSAAATRVSSVVNGKSSESVKEALQFANKLVESITAAHTKAKTAPESYDNVVQTITEEKRRVEDAVVKADEALKLAERNVEDIFTGLMQMAEKSKILLVNESDNYSEHGEKIPVAQSFEDNMSVAVSNVLSVMDSITTAHIVLYTTVASVDELKGNVDAMLQQAKKVLRAVQNVKTTTRNSVWKAAAVVAVEKVVEMQKKITMAKEKAAEAVNRATVAASTATEAVDAFLPKDLSQLKNMSKTRSGIKVVYDSHSHNPVVNQKKRDNSEKIKDALRLRAAVTKELTETVDSNTNVVMNTIREGQEMVKQASDAFKAAEEAARQILDSLRAAEETWKKSD